MNKEDELNIEKLKRGEAVGGDAISFHQDIYDTLIYFDLRLNRLEKILKGTLLVLFLYFLGNIMVSILYAIHWI